MIVRLSNCKIISNGIQNDLIIVSYQQKILNREYGFNV